DRAVCVMYDQIPPVPSCSGMRLMAPGSGYPLRGGSRLPEWCAQESRSPDPPNRRYR
ncbi:hypothetical protein NPIL_172261, partial [Nephila pilipes]